MAHIYVKSDAKFRFHKPRFLAFAVRSKIETDLDRLQLGVIEPVQTAECSSTSVVPVLKPNGTVRVCGDVKVTVSSYEDMQRYLLFHHDELRAALYGRKLCSKIDLDDTYL